MTQVGAVNQNFEGKQKFSRYDARKLESIAVNAASGNMHTAKAELDEFTKDKRWDKVRNFAISGAVLAGAIAARRTFAGKITKWFKTAGDVVCDWFRKGADDGRKVVTEFLDKNIVKDGTMSDGVKKILGKVIKNEDYLNQASEKVTKILNKIKVDKVEDIAEIGVAAGVGMTLDNPVNSHLDRADEAKDNYKANYTDGE
ncbi:MAG: hypothetical protein E7Z91_06345 [Cyanobacteria bacterium SIG30]|nr:hypothetical protein [Cyanobacteria bacterium SIG30]